LVRRLVSLFYKPSKQNFHASVSIVTPVYNEDPDVFRQALASWRANNPLEIIAVIDYTDEKCIREFEKFSRQFDQAKLIVTEKPGKRPALADGIRAARGKIIALVDSDVFWGKLVLREALRPFADPKVGGVAVRQNVLNPQALAQNIFDIQLDLRFFDEIMALNVAGNALTCFSGRTAFYRREALMPVVDNMVNETFWGKRCIGGDDKRLTYLIEAADWKGRYQHTGYVYTPGTANLSTLFKQRTRWARNTWRADLRALWQGWVWKRPFLAFVLVDRLISPLALLLSLMYFIVSLIFQLWIPAAILFVWWFFSRGVRIIPNLQRHPRNIRLVPAYVFANFAMAIVKIYGLLTLNRQDWITRRGAERAPKSGGFYLVLARIATLAILAGLAAAVACSRGILSF